MNAIATLAPPAAVPLRLIEDEPFYEIINGQRVELPPMGIYSVRLAFRLAFQINLFAQNNNLGEATTEALFHLPLPVDRNRRPDAAFVSFARWPKGKPQGSGENAWDVVPDLAIEVISPHDLVTELMEKIQEYFQAGVRLVWVVYPAQPVVYVYESFTSIRVLTRQDHLDGGAVLPGWRLPLTEIFLEEPEPLAPSE